MKKVINFANLCEKLDELASKPQDKTIELSLRQFVFATFDKLNDLFAKGFTRVEVADYLRQEGLEFSDTTFSNYLSEASRYYTELKIRAEKKARAASRAARKEAKNALSSEACFPITQKVKPDIKGRQALLRMDGEENAPNDGTFDPLDQPSEL